MKYNYTESQLELSIKELIDKKREGQYWDYKREWHSNKATLLRDIICLANTNHKGNRYLIIGVDDSGEIVGVENETQVESPVCKRYKQNQLIDFLSKNNFSNDNVPEIDLKTLMIQERLIDVIIIYDKSQKPYYLTADYKDQGEYVKGYYIYSRKGEVNTPKNQQCPEYEIGQMWRERFGLGMSPLERFKILLSKSEDWSQTNPEQHYHKLFPEFRIMFSECRKATNFPEPYPHFYLSEDMSIIDVALYFHSTLLFSHDCVYLDNHRLLTPAPLEKMLKLKDNLWYFYYIKNELIGQLMLYMNQGIFSVACGGEAPFIVFENAEESVEFFEFTNSSENLTIINEIYDATDITKILNSSSNPEILKKMRDCLAAKYIYEYWNQKCRYLKADEVY